jgi:hypothetical protein
MIKEPLRSAGSFHDAGGVLPCFHLLLRGAQGDGNPVQVRRQIAASLLSSQ